MVDDLSNCAKPPSRGGVPIKTVNSEMKRLGMPIKGLKKAEKCKKLTDTLGVKKVHLFNEEMATIMSLVDFETLSSMCKANKTMRNLCQQDWMWHERVKRHVPNPPATSTGSRWFWRDFYVVWYFDRLFGKAGEEHVEEVVMDVSKLPEPLYAKLILYLRLRKVRTLMISCHDRKCPQLDLRDYSRLRTLYLQHPARRSPLPPIPKQMHTLMIELRETAPDSALKSETRFYKRQIKAVWRERRPMRLHMLRGTAEEDHTLEFVFV